MKSLTYLHKNLLRLAFTAICSIMLVFTSLADYYTNDEVPDFLKIENSVPYGNYNFQVKYDYRLGKMVFYAIYHEKDGGGGIADAWAETIKIQYKLASAPSQDPFEDIASIYKLSIVNELFECTSLLVPTGIKYYGIAKSTGIDGIKWEAPAWNIYSRDGHHDVYVLKIVLDKIPTNWFGQEVKFAIFEEWERDEDGKAAFEVDNYSSPISLTLPTLDLSNTNPTADKESCNDKINITLTAPKNFDKTINSDFSDKLILNSLAVLKYKITWREKGTTTWNDLNSTYTECIPNSQITAEHAGTKGVEYEYQMKYSFNVRGDTYTVYITDDNTFTGSLIAYPPTPAIDSVVPGCEEATIHFSVPNNDISNIDHYVLTRLSTGFVYDTIVANIDKNAKSYTFNQPFGIESYILLIAVNECGDEKSEQSEIFESNGPPQNIPAISTIIQETNGALITWEINEDELTKEYSTFQVHHKTEGENDYILIAEDIPFNTRLYLDSSADMCNENHYIIKLVNECGENSSGDSSIVLTSDFKEVINPEKVTASTGYFNNRIEINWQYFPGLKDAVTGLKILRKKPEDISFIQVKFIDENQTVLWNDMDAEANELYQYKLVAVGDCYGEQTSDTVEIVGFRLKTGIVTGNISFDGGNPVEGVEVKISEGTSPSSSLSFVNTNNNYLLLKDSTVLTNLNEFTIEMWVFSGQWKSMNNSQNLAANRDFRLLLYNGTIQFKKFKSPATTIDFYEYKANYEDYIDDLESWHHVAASFASDSIKIYFDGENIGKFKNQDTGNYPFTSLNTFIGARTNSPANVEDYETTDVKVPATANDFNGNLDEVKIWNYVKTEEELARDYQRIIIGDETGLITYLRFDEGFGDVAYDRSKTGDIFNKNDAEINGATWTSFTPSFEKLHSSGISDQHGNYVVGGIPYSGTGEIFNVTPEKGVHVFSPSQKPLFIGDNQLVHNDVDFIDKSAFEMPVKVMYTNATYYPVADVYVKIDGNYVIGKDNFPVKTANNGEITIEVPIGNHYISVEKDGHLFASSYWPPKNDGVIVDHYFEEDFAEAIQFEDITTVKLVGKVVGGSIEQGRPIGSKTNPTNNNIGTAQLSIGLINEAYELNPGKIDTLIPTDTETGVYEINLIPEMFKITSVATGDYQFITQNTGNTIVDLNNKFSLNFTVDSIYIGDVFQMLDTAFVFNHQQDFILRNPPTFSILDFNDEHIHGDIEITVLDDGQPIPIPVIEGYPNNISYKFGYPVFSMGRMYEYHFKAFEQYENFDTKEIDKCPVSDGDFIINNNIRELEEEEQIELDGNGEAVYTFIAGTPTVANPYINTINVQLKIGNNFYNNPECPIECYILGTKPTGNNFVTSGPDQLNYILRDPYGSGSSATLSIGTTVNNQISPSVKLGTNNNIDFTTSTGQNIVVASGVPGFMQITEIETVSENTLTTKINGFTSEGTSSSTTINFGSSLSTSSSTSYVGADGDIFYGNSTNIIFGENRDICITEKQEPAKDEIVIDSIQHNTEWYYLKRKNKLGVGTNFATEFIFTQKYIESTLLPNLERLRNDLLANNPNYISILNISDPDYGKNNDDPVFSNDSVLLETTIDGSIAFYGESYYYLPDSTTYTSMTGTVITFENLQNDSVRYLNNQIVNWKYYLTLNEIQKLAAEFDDNHKNISFDAGSSYQGSISTTKTKSYSITSSLYLSAQVTTELGFLAQGAGAKCELTHTQYINGDISGGQTTASTVSTSFNLSDSDLHNYFTMDVKKCQAGNGPVFATRGGQSSCPYESEAVTKYLPGSIVLSNATVQIEVPGLSANTNNISGVYEDEPAYFELYLSNESEANVDNWFTIITDNATNPYNAELFMDGAALATGIDIKVPAGQTITKTIEFHKGTPDIFNYENIRVLMKSRCDAKIWKEEFLTVNFEPSCSDVDITNLANEWVMNLSNNDTLSVEIGDYNRNNINLQNISFQYKRPGELIPTTMMNFYNDSVDYNSAPDPKAMIEETKINYDAGFTTGTFSDGIYDIRSVASCDNGVENFYTESSYIRGTIDRLAPHLFGLPQPADGILSLGDEIQVKFNETIDEGFLYMRNDLITVRGIKNGTDLSASEYILHNACVSFDGQNQHLLIPQGVNLKYSSFTIEFWAQRKQTGKECLFYQSTPGSSGLWIGFDESDKFTAVYNTDTIKTDFEFDNIQDQWCHFAFVYDVNEDVDNLLLSVLYDAGNEIKLKTATSDYFGTSPVYIGNTSLFDNGFMGEMHGLRIWNNALSTGDLVANKSTILTGYETGLIGCWPLDDTYGDKAKDLAFARHADMNATWQVTKKGKALNLANNSYFSFNSGGMIFSNQTNFTIEFWFKGDVPLDSIYLFGNGLADGTDGFESAWAIMSDNSENIVIRNNGTDFSFSGVGFFDNNWHHLAVTVNRRGNTNAYLDGELKYTISANGTTAFGGSNCYVGASYHELTGGGHFDDFFIGGIDEIRVWNSALPINMISQNLHTTLSGDEPGLKAYFPFEDVNETNPLILNASLNNFSQSNYLNAGDGTVSNDIIISPVTPMLKLSPPKASIDFTYSINNDEVMITPTEDANSIENTNLEISIRRVKDMFGNEMASTEIWNAFVDKNQLVWDKQSITLEKDNESELTFKMLVFNKGGQAEQFKIINLPAWLSASPEFGYLDPLQSEEIVFTVNPAINTGNYSHDVYLNGSMNYNERLTVKLSVTAKEPVWSVIPEDFENSMILIGKIKIGENFSTDINDKVGAFINDECRGVANLQYFPDFDIYLINITIHDDLDGEIIEFKIWDASEGFIYGDVFPTPEFNNDTILGKSDDPVTIYSAGQIASQILLNKGWTWVSFNLNSSKLDSINLLMDSEMANNSLIVKTRDYYAQKSGGKMVGNLERFYHNKLYLFNMENEMILNYSGLPVLTDTAKIGIENGWNWIGYTPQLRIPVKEAFSYFTPKNDDVVKSQYQFAMYNEVLGWIGNLEYLEPKQGYKYKSNMLQNFSFTYPHEPLLKSEFKEVESELLFNIEVNKWPDNMSLIGEFKTENNELIKGLSLVAYSLNEPRGYTNPTNIENSELLFLTIHGEMEENIEFAAMSLENKQLIPLEKQMIFNPYKVWGTINNPVVFVLNDDQLAHIQGLGKTFGVNCYPNPFSNDMSIIINPSDFKSIATIKIYGLDGRLHRIIETQKSLTHWDGKNQNGSLLPQGIYTVNVVVNGKVFNNKVIKK